MSEVSFSEITIYDGDMGSHCNSCMNKALYKIQLRSVSVRVCEACFFELLAQMRSSVIEIMDGIEADSDIRNYQSRWRRLREVLELKEATP